MKEKKEGIINGKRRKNIQNRRTKGRMKELIIRLMKRLTDLQAGMK